MGIIKKLSRSIIYHCTQKPSCYVHVDKPKTLQDYRQVQYNNWCKRKGVYNGSYLPTNPNTLLKKGWIETTYIGNNKNSEFTRKSSGQKVRFDPENKRQIPHYHWSNPHPKKIHHKKITEYLDRYGNPCTKSDPSHHLAPLDKDCPKNAFKRYLK